MNENTWSNYIQRSGKYCDRTFSISDEYSENKVGRKRFEEVHYYDDDSWITDFLVCRDICHTIYNLTSHFTRVLKEDIFKFAHDFSSSFRGKMYTYSRFPFIGSGIHSYIDVSSLRKPGDKYSVTIDFVDYAYNDIMHIYIHCFGTDKIKEVSDQLKKYYEGADEQSIQRITNDILNEVENNCFLERIYEPPRNISGPQIFYLKFIHTMSS